MRIDELVGANKNKLKILAMFALVFTLGFASGYYYLNDSGNGGILTIKDNSDNCSKLFKDDAQSGSLQKFADYGTPDKASKTAADESKSLPGNGIVKGASNSDTAQKAFAGSKNSTLYHIKDCQYVKRIKSENLVWFSSQQEAEAAGKKLHSCAE